MRRNSFVPPVVFLYIRTFKALMIIIHGLNDICLRYSFSSICDCFGLWNKYKLQYFSQDTQIEFITHLAINCNFFLTNQRQRSFDTISHLLNIVVSNCLFITSNSGNYGKGTIKERDYWEIKKVYDISAYMNTWIIEWNMVYFSNKDFAQLKKINIKNFCCTNQCVRDSSRKYIVFYLL